LVRVVEDGSRIGDQADPGGRDVDDRDTQIGPVGARHRTTFQTSPLQTAAVRSRLDVTRSMGR
jgi:hypothetical protein